MNLPTVWRFYPPFAGTIGQRLFFDYFLAWVNALPSATIEQFLSHRDAGNSPLLDAVLSERLGPERYAQLVKKISPEPQSLLWKYVQIQDDLARGDKAQARHTFATLSPTQPVSIVYNNLAHELGLDNAGATREGIGAYDPWPVWDDAADKFMESTSAQLNERIEYLDQDRAPTVPRGGG